MGDLHRRHTHRRRLASATALALAIWAAGQAQPAAAAAPDYAVPGTNCHFFTQANGNAGPDLGYSVCDDASARMWSEFQRLGGINVLGYPISNRFTWDGFIVQATQREILQWRPDSRRAVFINVYDKLHDLRQDDWLKAFRSVPPPVDVDHGAAPTIYTVAPGDALWGIARKHGTTVEALMAANGLGDETVQPGQALKLAAGRPSGDVRRAWLDANPAIKRKYLSAADPLQANGLPMAPVFDAGPFVVLRNQRNAIQQWKVSLPAARIKAGDVTVTLGGNDAKAAGILPDKAALAPAPPPGAAAPVPAALPATTPTPSPPATPAVPDASLQTFGMRYGFAVHAYNGLETPAVQATKNAGFGWIKQQVEWARLQGGRSAPIGYGELDTIVSTAAGAGLKVLLSVAKGPGWARADGHAGPPDNPDDFGAFVNALASHYKGKVQAYECWNEENLAVEVGPGNIDPARFVPLLKACYKGIKAADASAIVISGAPTPTGVNDPAVAMDDALYLQRLYAYNNGEVKAYFDALGSHPEAFGNSPDETVDSHSKPSFATHPSFFFARVKQYHDIMVAAGDAGKQIFATEFGCDSSSTSVPGYEYAQGVSEQDQAAWLARAFQKANTDYAPWLGMIAVWNLNFQAIVPPNDEKWGWGVLRSDWTGRPAYTALQQMPKPNAQ